ncbi:hypothetical protein COCSUDRAFT_34803 [Coccomyxa subellipsoidea C-169]|uniref:mRNA guanylyltransferase n=1 Tax=Coccomyxa subellipsoidea (strain C-169) TaxID=574566 RepID=I0Z9S3_COCSC|nr:hypothetical protein COCSUDRAFT_34803 [Coccomyxa subellipsoidea C-169]EIE27392.1 hypothetical protein COCSUDRAFT_34803 [Coccomyxa subellipsoidea C-169]|eukprot:XP_005651936.1 hypothetical protein COCSUDRAFT_34803 [Coccomyxa subellipsoidea C-169]
MPPGLELPSGWIDCPPMGHRITPLMVVPVPLGHRFSRVLSDEEHFSPVKLMEQLHAKGVEVGLLIDLTNTWRYYERDEIDALGVEHLKVCTPGNPFVPEPEAVNTFVWELMSYYHRANARWAVLHCTHGFNRTGSSGCQHLVRSMSVERALRIFAEHRPPGIYKEDYIRELYKYNHEPLPSGFQAPKLPAWKPEEPDSPKADHILDSALVHGIEHEVPAAQLRFPGGQPVSLDRANLGKLREKRYWVTWKADGTRYMLLLCKWGVYLIDRSFNVRRVQMRFPVQLVGKDGQLQAHHMTLLDGEMLVDEDIAAGTQTRRFLAYDLIALHGKSLSNLPSKERWARMEEKVMRPRRKERDGIRDPKIPYPVRYDYGSELFSVRRKEFWPLSRMSTLLDQFIPSLPHEADGLIFQGYDEEYVAGTDFNLLKWKFAHLNSVDFRLRSTAAGARVVFDEGMDVTRLENCIVECSWDGEEGVWRYMRVRSDKDTPNAYHVYEKVMQSIHDNITEEDLQEEIKIYFAGHRAADESPFL